jgi:glycosyltransferase involved in cell wall biosynthesis
MPASTDPGRKVLVSAYACEPGKGSEPGAGWLWALAAAEQNRVWVLTRSNNRRAIEADPASRSESLTFVYADLPQRFAWWKPHGRFIRLYYLLWQVEAMRVARRLHARERFDLIHHVTFANVHLPALAAAVDAPFLLGPVAGGQRVARAHLRYLGGAGIGIELALRLARVLARVNPLVRFGWRRAALILLNNPETANDLPRAVRRKTTLRPAQCVTRSIAAPPTQPGETPVAVCSGRLHRFKGVELAIRAVDILPEWRLRVIGDGPDAKRLRSLVAQLRLEPRVEFVSTLPQEELWQLVSGADAFVLPSLKEGGGFAAVEAAALGLPVVAFAQGGPAGVQRYYRTDRFHLVQPEDGYAGLAEALRRLGKRHVAGPPLEATRDRVSDDLERLYSAVAPGRSASG